MRQSQNNSSKLLHGWRRTATVVLVALLPAILYPVPAWAQSDTPDLRGSLSDAVIHGETWVNLRYRFERVDQSGLPRKAVASTARTRIGYATGEWHGLSLLFELENTAHVGNDRFNDGSDPISDRPVVTDPDSTEANQIALRLSTPWRTQIIAGRHRVVLDDERFFGDAAFRQNQQTFDGVTVINRSLPGAELRYDYLTGVQRPLGSDSRQGS